MKVGIWGGTQAGKTMYIGSLRTYALHRGGWTVDGNDQLRPNSQEFMDDLTNSLAEWRLPPGTRVDATYAFTLGQKTSGLFGSKKQEFQLVVDDRRGSVFSTDMPVADQLWSDLASCKGLIFLFDPDREEKADAARQRAAEQSASNPFRGSGRFSPGDQLPDDDEDVSEGGSFADDSAFDTERGNFHYVQHIGSRIKAASRKKDLKDGLLPHFLAVCVTKFDHQLVFDRLRAHGLVEPNPEEDGRYAPGVVPRVPRAQAKKAFQLLADRKTISSLEGYFSPAQIQYFVVSASGLYLPKGEDRIDPTDTSNVIGLRTRSEVRPLGVFDPIQWLMQKIK